MRSQRRACFTDVVVLGLLLALGTLCRADNSDIQDLVSAGKLEISATLKPPGPIVPGQKMTLTLAIATDSWFTGGTRIKLPEVPGLVILQTEQFASNASERRGDQSWVIQRWNLDVYPQRVGAFTLPPIKAGVKVNGGSAGNLAGELTSPALDFTVSLPPELQDISTWVAAPTFTVEQRFDRSPETLQVGDAFEREILLEASDVLAMMLPAFEAEQLAGLAAYPSPPVLDNASNRGQTIATRSQRISYVAQTDGAYRLPARDFFWWDTGRGELQVITLPATNIVVGTGVAPAENEGNSNAGFTPRQIILGVGSVVLLALLLWLGRKLWRRLPIAPLMEALASAWQALKDLRKPALPDRLNPDNSAVE